MSFQTHTVLMSCTLFSFGGIFQVFYKALSFFFFLFFIIDQSSQVSFRPTHAKEHQPSLLIWRRIKVEVAFNSLNFPASNAKWEQMTASGSKEPHNLPAPHLKNSPITLTSQWFTAKELEHTIVPFYLSFVFKDWNSKARWAAVND